MTSSRVALVDDQNRFLRWMTREALHAIEGPHRSVQVMVVDREGRLIVQKRHASKLTHPSTWDLSCSGHVEEHDYPDPSQPDADLDAIYDAVARRELHEELGVDAELRLLGAFAPTPGVHYEHFHLYLAISDGPFTPEAGEVERVAALDRAALDELLAAPEERVTPSLGALVAWAREHSILR